MNTQYELKKQLLDYLRGRHAHVLLPESVAGLSAADVNASAKNFPYTIWQLLEHIRLTQNDIVDFARNPKYAEKSWPKDYWPPAGKKADNKMWAKSIAGYKKDFADLIKIAKNPKINLLTKIPHGQGQTILREIILVIDHNAYHVGEIVAVRRALGLWKT